MGHLKNNGIGTRPFYPALHAEPVYNRSDRYPVAERIASQGLWLPSSSNLADDDIARACSAIRNYF